MKFAALDRLQKRGLCIALRGLSNVNAFIKFLSQIAGVLFLKKGVRRVAHDPKEPGASVPFLITPKETHRAETRLLNNILSIVRISDEPSRQIISRIEVRQYHLLEVRPIGYAVRFLLHIAIRLSTTRTVAKDFRRGYLTMILPIIIGWTEQK